jgi:hypothetical protein
MSRAWILAACAALFCLGALNFAFKPAAPRPGRLFHGRPALSVTHRGYSGLEALFSSLRHRVFQSLHHG